MKCDRPKPYTIMVRGLQWTTVIERMFHAESAKIRDEWINAIKVFILKIGKISLIVV